MGATPNARVHVVDVSTRVNPTALQDVVLDVLAVVQDLVQVHVMVVHLHVVLDVLRYRSQSNQLLMEPSRDLLTVPAIHIKELR